MSQEHFGPAVFALTKGWKAILDARFAPLGLSEARWQCLLHLGRAKGAIAQVDLAERMGITPPTLVKLLDRLEDDGWIERQQEPGDRRSKRVLLTAKAAGLAREVEAEALRLRADIFSAVSAKELQLAEDVINKLLGRVEQLRVQSTNAEAEATATTAAAGGVYDAAH